MLSAQQQWRFVGGGGGKINVVLGLWFKGDVMCGNNTNESVKIQIGNGK